MSTNLITGAQPGEKKPLPAQAFEGRGLLEPLNHGPGNVQKLRENLLSCASQDINVRSFAESVISVHGTRISGGPALLIETSSGPFLLYKEPFQGFHLIVSGLLGKKPDDSATLRKPNGDIMRLVAVPEGKSPAPDAGQG